jgi:hypothetical protein
MRWWAKSRFTTMSWSHSMHTLPNHTRAGKLQYKKDHVWKAWKTPWRADFRRCRNKSSDEISLTRHRSSSRGGWGSVQLDDLAFSTLAVPRRAPPTSRPAHAPRMQATTQLRRAHYPVLTCSIVFVSGVYRRILRPTHLTKKNAVAFRAVYDGSYTSWREGIDSQFGEESFLLYKNLA